MRTPARSAILIWTVLAALGVAGCGSGGGGGGVPSPPKVTLDLVYDGAFHYTCDSESLPCPATPDLGAGTYADDRIDIPSQLWRASQSKYVLIDVRVIDLDNVGDISVRLVFNVEIVDAGGGTVTNQPAGRTVTFAPDPANPVASRTVQVICRLDGLGETLGVEVSASDLLSARSWLNPVNIVLH